MVEFKLSLYDAVERQHASLGRRLLSVTEEHERLVQEMRDNFTRLEKLEDLMPGSPLFSRLVRDQFDARSNIVYVEYADLPKFREALGEIKITGKWLHNAEKRLARVSLSCEKIPGLRLVYMTEVEEDGPCKIVASARPTEYDLLCEVTPSGRKGSVDDYPKLLAGDIA